MSSTFVWYELHTSDIAGAGAFYTGVFGWGRQDHSSGGGHYEYFTVGDTPIGGFLEKTNPNGGWVGYIGVGDLKSALVRLKEAGGTIHRDPEDIPGVGRFSVVADPQGAVFLLFQPKSGQDQPPSHPEGTQGTPAWHDLATTDWKAAFDFYAGMFGWKKDQAMDMGPNGTYQMFAPGPRPIGGMMNRMDESKDPGWMFYFYVDEINAAIERVKQHGGTVIHGPSEVPGGQMIAHCLDTHGAAFGMVTPEMGNR